MWQQPINSKIMTNTTTFTNFYGT